MPSTTPARRARSEDAGTSATLRQEERFERLGLPVALARLGLRLNENGRLAPNTDWLATWGSR